MGRKVFRMGLPLFLILFEIAMIAVFSVLVEYADDATPQLMETDDGNHTQKASPGPSYLNHYYPMFQDVHVMIFVGFGLLMMFLKRYGFSSVGLNMLIAAVCLQWATVVSGLMEHHGGTFCFDVVSMLKADFASAAVLITFGALLGKTSPSQMIVVTIIEIVIFTANEHIGVMLEVVDVGGSIFVHAFGAYFGLAVSRVLHREDVDTSKKEGSVYHSDMFAMVGTLFLWLFWPSFNSALAVEDAQHRAVINTYLALASCCVVAFAISSLVDRHGKFDMVHIQNATLAGGVAVGTSADMMIQPCGALLIGSVAGCLSVIGYKFITPFLASKLNIHDTCGVHNLHGMPAILAGIAGAIATLNADTDTYGYTLYRQFPAMAPTNSSSPEWDDLRGHVEVTTGLGRSPGEQAGYQALALTITLVVAVVGGVLVGLLLKCCRFLGQPAGPGLFEDIPNFHVPDDSETGVVDDVITELDKRGKTIYKGNDQGFSPLLVS